jgi:hypothetical protein
LLLSQTLFFGYNAAMVKFIIFAIIAWFAIGMLKDMLRATEQKKIEAAKKEAREAQKLARAQADAERAEAQAIAKADRAAKKAAAAAANLPPEEMVSCAICGTYVPKHDAIAFQGKFYSSEAHFLQRNAPAPQMEMPSEESAEAMQAVAENI